MPQRPMKHRTQRSPRLAVHLLAVLTAIAPRVFAADPCGGPFAGVPCPVGAMQCYEVKPGAFARRSVTVEDRFGTLADSVRFPHRFCFPLDGNVRAASPQTQ